MKEVSLLLDQHSYTEAMPQTVWHSKTYQDIAASIVGVLTRCWMASWNKCCKPFGKCCGRRWLDSANTSVHAAIDKMLIA